MAKRATILAAFLALLPRPAAAGAKIEARAQALFDLANQERISRGIPALKWDASLAEAARAHALRMAQENALSHQFPGEPDLPARESQAGAKVSAAAENIALGPSAAVIHNGWMNSPPHRHNLLDPQLNSIGIAVVLRGGDLFAVEDFSRALAALSLAGQEKEVEAPIRAAGLTIRPDNADARRVCSGGHPAGPRPMFVGQFSTIDLSPLPRSIEHAVQSGQYVAAEVGACAKPSVDGLGQYHIAVLLY